MPEPMWMKVPEMPVSYTLPTSLNDFSQPIFSKRRFISELVNAVYSDNGLLAQVESLKTSKEYTDDFMAFMTAELAKFECCCEKGEHKSTMPMCWPELIHCIIKKAVAEATSVPEQIEHPTLKPGDEVWVRAEYLFSNIRNEVMLQLRDGICCYEVSKGFCITVPLASVRTGREG